VGGGLRSLGVELPSLGGSTPTTVSSNVTLSGGAQTVTMTQLADAYSPADTTVYAGIPIRWVIESEAPYTCAAFLRVPDLGVKADLTLGTNTVELPALGEGTTPFSCSMGMYSGSLTAIPPPA
jgi:plastocyanin domain-containing protein